MSENWQRVRLQDVTSKVGSGSTPRGGEESYKTSGIPLIRSMNVIFFGFKREGLAHIDEQQAEKLQSVEVNHNDILLNITGASIGRVTLSPKDLQGARVNQHVCIIRPTQVLEPRFLRAFLSSPEMQQIIGSENYGVTRQALTKQQILDFEIPIPPIAEQIRIADKLDSLLSRVDACRERLDRVPAILKRFRQAVLAAATSGELTKEWREMAGESRKPQRFDFDDAESFRDYEFPSSWSICRLSDIAQIVGGITKDSKKNSFNYPELPYLRVANVQRGYLDLTEIKTISVPPEKIDALLLKKGDILFNEGGDIDKLGRGWIWNEEIERCIFQNHVFRARLTRNDFEPRYFSWYGNSRGYDYFLSRGKQTTNLASINKGVLSALPVAVPPPGEQTEIVRRVDALFDLASRLERRFTTIGAQASQLTPSLLAKAFRGELVPQDPNDEPASELLARIRASSSQAEPAKRGRKTDGNKVPRAPRETSTMAKTRNDEDVRNQDYLARLLRHHGGSTDVATLFKDANLSVTDFYKQLAWEIEQGYIHDDASKLEAR